MQICSENKKSKKFQIILALRMEESLNGEEDARENRNIVQLS